MAKRVPDVREPEKVRRRLDQTPEPGDAAQRTLQSEPQVSPRGAEENTATLPAPGLVSEVGLTVAKRAPVLVARAEDFKQLGLTEDVWKLLLGRLEVLDLVMASRSCRGLFHWGGELLNTALQDSLSSAGKRQKRYAATQLLDWMRQDEPMRLMSGPAEPARQFACYGLVIEDLASRLQCLELMVAPGLEDQLIQALLKGTKWESLTLNVAIGSDSGVVQRLEQGLHLQGRRCELQLVFAGRDEIGKLLPEGTALTLAGLGLWSGNGDDLAALHPLLTGLNTLRHVSLFSVHAAGNALNWMQRGSAGLVELHVHAMRYQGSGKQLIDVLQRNPGIVSLSLGYGEFREDLDPGVRSPGMRSEFPKFTLPQVLHAAPNLQNLTLSGFTFLPGSGAGCEQALREASLRQIAFYECLLCKHKNGQVELLDGLRGAPGLKVLGLTVGAAAEGYHVDTAMLLLEAYAGNPAARLVTYRNENERRIFQAKLVALNEERSRQAWVPIDIRFEPEITFFSDWVAWR